MQTQARACVKECFWVYRFLKVCAEGVASRNAVRHPGFCDTPPGPALGSLPSVALPSGQAAYIIQDTGVAAGRFREDGGAAVTAYVPQTAGACGVLDEGDTAMAPDTGNRKRRRTGGSLPSEQKRPSEQYCHRPKPVRPVQREA